MSGDQQSMEEGCPLDSHNSTQEDLQYTENGRSGDQVDGAGHKELKDNSMREHSSVSSLIIGSSVSRSYILSSLEFRMKNGKISKLRIKGKKKRGW